MSKVVARGVEQIFPVLSSPECSLCAKTIWFQRAYRSTTKDGFVSCSQCTPSPEAFQAVYAEILQEREKKAALAAEVGRRVVGRRVRANPTYSSSYGSSGRNDDQFLTNTVLLSSMSCDSSGGSGNSYGSSNYGSSISSFSSGSYSSSSSSFD